MNINNPPVFDQIVDTNGVIIRPTVYTVETGYQDVTWNVLKPILNKTIALPSWDMDNVVTLNVTHGIDLSVYRILSIDVEIRRDTAASDQRNANLYASVNNGSRDINAITPDVNTIRLARLTGGDFDSVNYTSTAFSRGFMYITYRLI